MPYRARRRQAQACFRSADEVYRIKIARGLKRRAAQLSAQVNHAALRLLDFPPRRILPVLALWGGCATIKASRQSSGATAAAAPAGGKSRSPTLRLLSLSRWPTTISPRRRSSPLGARVDAQLAGIRPTVTIQIQVTMHRDRDGSWSPPPTAAESSSQPADRRPLKSQPPRTR